MLKKIIKSSIKIFFQMPQKRLKYHFRERHKPKDNGLLCPGFYAVLSVLGLWVVLTVMGTEADSLNKKVVPLQWQFVKARLLE